MWTAVDLQKLSDTLLSNVQCTSEKKIPHVTLAVVNMETFCRVSPNVLVVTSLICATVYSLIIQKQEITTRSIEIVPRGGPPH